jgi:hypothetical protein
MIDKKVIILWSVCFLIIFFGIHYLDGWPQITDWFGIVLSIFFGFALLLITSVILSIVIASYPFNSRETPGKKKIRRYIPISTIILTFFSLALFKGTRPSFSKENPEADWLCRSVKEGIFQLDEYLIERNGNIHIEINSITGKKSTYHVKWLTDCEFELKNFDDSTDITKVKITKVTKDAYDCVALLNGRTTKHKLAILKSGD